ncbi:hypothetical protein BDV59DRAFT_174924 [Aspergillus ambiguus]|uniref:uncharacterized protein n=1 Tax=Aspergillus ambiguus TaxID=176160 RepID=UPI003CCD3E53
MKATERDSWKMGLRGPVLLGLLLVYCSQAQSYSCPTTIQRRSNQSGHGELCQTSPVWPPRRPLPFASTGH